MHWALDGLGTRSKLIDPGRIIDNALDPYAPMTKDFLLAVQRWQGDGPETRAPGQKPEAADDGNLDDFAWDEIDQ